uniref:Protein dispatched homolog 3 isoform X1 n=1 Tax=Geotrypetes seraphini TaxID=260995 RepID=A0A6P8PVD0_GEOSA|nr:protein dispatched homolog 3 isoform X1 [Geotrypetes seraphini]
MVSDMDMDNNSLLQDAWFEEEEEDVTFSSEKSPGIAQFCGMYKGLSKPTKQVASITGFWSLVGWIFTNVYFAGLILFLGCAVPTVLAALMFFHYPPLDIDISYSAFEVRDHEASQRFDALSLALKFQFGSWGRNRRDLADFTSEALQQLISERLQALHLNVSRPGSSMRSRHSTMLQAGDQRTSPVRKKRSPTLKASGQRRANESLHHPRWSYPGISVSASAQTHAHWRLELIFLAQGDAERNIFTEERLLTIHHIERKIMDHPRFREFCWKPHEVLKDLPLGPYSYCSPPSSLLTYFFPTEKGGKIFYDGMGQDLADIEGSLKLAMTHPEFYWFVDQGMTAENMQSTLLRSEILFGAPLPSYYSLEDRWEEQQRKFQEFVVTYVPLLAKESTSKVHVLYGGTDLFDYEVRQTFSNDMLLAFISSSCIAALVYILTSCSVFLSFFGIASIGLSCLVSLFLYHVIFEIQYLGILNGVAAFVIVGIGVDDVFVFVNTYRQATHFRDPQPRMIHTVQTAGKATFFTSLTTAAAYAANIFSQIPAVHDFGLFMSLIVSCCWLAVLFIMPAALGIWSLYILPLESSCYASCREKCGTKSSRYISDDPLWGSASTPAPEGIQYLDDDIPLLSVEEEPVTPEMGDVPLVSVLPESFQQQQERSSRGLVITQLQQLLQHWVLWSTVKSRWIIVGLFVSILILSIFFACRLQPASRAPVLFKPDTNIQVLLDLKYNLSAEGISCITCSGLFQEKPHSLQNNIRTSSEKKKRGFVPHWDNAVSTSKTGEQDHQSTVYVTRCKVKDHPTVYRLSLNASTPMSWQPVLPRDGEIPSFQVYNVPFGNFTKKLTACVSTVGLSKKVCTRKWLLTSSTCDSRRGWKFDFSFYVADEKQQLTRNLYFAQSHKPPFHGRVCVSPPGCLLSAGPNSSSRGTFYIPREKVILKEKVSFTSGFNPCVTPGCGKPAVRPLVDTGAMVFVVFGILGINHTKNPDNHVLGEVGSVIYDDSFDLFKEIGNLCRVCKAIASNMELVKPGGAQCLPSGYSISSFLQMLHPECKNIPEPNLLPGQLSHGTVGVNDGKVRWISMAFESTTYKGKSSFQTYEDYLKWERFLQQELHLLPEGSALLHGFQTCQHWKQIFMEIIGVQSALYGLILSLLICVTAVAVFTTHLMLLLPVLLTILGVVCLVVAIMYWSGWEMGAVEAISLSILVGSSVDYCVHLVEGYLLAGENLPLHQTQDPSSCRQWRALEAVRHVGVAIVSSAVTTVCATIPLFFCIIAPFAKFGKIVALNTGVSVLYTLTVSTALLSIMGPSTFTRSRTSLLKALLGVFLTAAVSFSLYLVLLKSGFRLPLPRGSP